MIRVSTESLLQPPPPTFVVYAHTVVLSVDGFLHDGKAENMVPNLRDEGGSKIGKFMKKKLCWLTTHKG